MEIHLDNYLPEYPSFVSGIRRAPDRGYSLTPAQTETALMNALRYIPVDCLLYTSDAADDTPCVDLGGRRIIKKIAVS